MTTPSGSQQIETLRAQLFAALLRKEQLRRDIDEVEKNVAALTNIIAGADLGKKAATESERVGLKDAPDDPPE